MEQQYQFNLTNNTINLYEGIERKKYGTRSVEIKIGNNPQAEIIY